MAETRTEWVVEQATGTKTTFGTEGAARAYMEVHGGFQSGHREISEIEWEER